MAKPVNFTPFKDAVEKSVNASSDHVDCAYLDGDLKIGGAPLVIGVGIGDESKDLFPVEEELS